MTALERLSAAVPVSDEAIVDYRIGTLAEWEAAQRRMDAREAEAEARWRAIPIGARAVIRVKGRSRRYIDGARERIARRLWPYGWAE